MEETVCVLCIADWVQRILHQVKKPADGEAERIEEQKLVRKVKKLVRSNQGGVFYGIDDQGTAESDKG